MTGVVCALTGVWLGYCVSAKLPGEGLCVVRRSQLLDSELRRDNYENRNRSLARNNPIIKYLIEHQVETIF